MYSSSNDTTNQEMLTQLESLQLHFQELQTKLQLSEEQNRTLRQELQNSNEKLKRTQAQRDIFQKNYEVIIHSRGHQLLTKLYDIKRRGVSDFLRQSFSKTVCPEPDMYSCQVKIQYCHRINVLTTPQNYFIARLMQSHLAKSDIECEIHFTEHNYEDVPYILIGTPPCKRLPTTYILYQTETLIDSDSIANNIPYYYGAYAIFDYSLKNIDILSKNKKISKKLYYMPLDYCPNLHNTNFAETEYDVLVYNPIVSDRYNNIINRLNQHFNLKIITDLHEDALFHELKKAKIILNIQPDVESPLNIKYLIESLSVSNAIVISENGEHCEYSNQLDDVVNFMETGNIDALIEKIHYWLNNNTHRMTIVQANHVFLSHRANATGFYLNRFLLANDRITFDYFYSTFSDYIKIESNRLCLSLPETPERRADFDADNKFGFEVFPGLKHYMGWIGCGLSYKFIFKKIIEKGIDTVLICEDDTFFPPDFDVRFHKITDYLETHDDWEIFNGIIADIGDTKLLKVVTENNEDYLYVDRMISTVFNIYRKPVFEEIANWNNTNHDAETNTIDRYLHLTPHKIITTLPFIIGHKEDMLSTIWDSENIIYTDKINYSIQRLQTLREAYKTKHSTEI